MPKNQAPSEELSSDDEPEELSEEPDGLSEEDPEEEPELPPFTRTVQVAVNPPSLVVAVMVTVRSEDRL